MLLHSVGQRWTVTPTVAMTTGETIPAHSQLSRLRFPGNRYTNVGKHPGRSLHRLFWSSGRGITAGVLFALQDSCTVHRPKIMATSPLPFLDNRESLQLKVEHRIRNIFVTQPEDTRWACGCTMDDMSTVCHANSPWLHLLLLSLQAQKGERCPSHPCCNRGKAVSYYIKLYCVVFMLGYILIDVVIFGYFITIEKGQS